MNITFALNVFRWHIGALNVRIELDQTGNQQQIVDRGVKSMSRWWTRHMAS